MDRGDYYEAKAAVQNLRAVQAENALRLANASHTIERVMAKLGVPVGAGYTFDDTTLTIAPVQAGGQ